MNGRYVSRSALMSFLLTAAGSVAAPEETPTLRCSPDKVGLTGTVTLTMSMPHPRELAVVHPDGTQFFLVYEPDADQPKTLTPLFSREEFARLRQVQLRVQDAKGSPWVAERVANEPIFTAPGNYIFMLADTLESESLPVYSCSVRLKDERS
jgi:hypothetical protein